MTFTCILALLSDTLKLSFGYTWNLRVAEHKFVAFGALIKRNIRWTLNCVYGSSSDLPIYANRGT